MNPLLSWLAAPAWTPIVQALLHSLWQGAILAVLLALLFRCRMSPAWRHRLALGALGVLLVTSLLTWAVLSQAPRTGASPTAASSRGPEVVRGPAERATQPAAILPGKPPAADPGHERDLIPRSWTAWLALAWIAGVLLMLFRAGVQATRADRLRRSGLPVTDPSILAILAEAQRALGVVRRVRLIVNETLASPAVIGVLVPMLILPGSLLTSLTQDQLRFVILHELAHIRRGDYLSNLFQVLVEALFFFNPAVWWISRQARSEREACCDLLATDASGAPADYARTLIHVAETALNWGNAEGDWAQAMAGDREPSSLAERVKRLIVPGYRPALRMTWRGMLVALVLGGALLLLSAVGTRLTVAAILSPQERMDRIEQKMVAYGIPASESDSGREVPNAPKARITGRVVDQDGQPLRGPKWVNLYSMRRRSSGVSSGRLQPDGTFSTDAQFGRFCVGLEAPGYAPAASPWIEVTSTNPIHNIELVVSRGFASAVEVTDRATGRPVPGAEVTIRPWLRNFGMSIGSKTNVETDASGTARLTHCSDSVALRLTVQAAGYEIVDQEFPQVTPNEPLRVRLARGREIPGRVLSRADGSPIARATVRVIHEVGPETRHYEWRDDTRWLAETDDSGRFTANRLRRDTQYWLGISAPGHESVIVPLPAGAAEEIKAGLGPELIVRGEVHGALDQLQMIDRDRCLSRNFSEHIEDSSYGYQEWVRLRVTNGVGYFEFTNRVAGRVTLSGNAFREEREITAPLAGWIVNLQAAQSNRATNRPQREVVFRFQHPSGIPPRGTVSVLVPDSFDPKEPTAHEAVLGITNGEVRASIAIGGMTHVEARQTYGFWFKGPDYFRVTNGPGPLVVDVPCLAAGAIFARAWNADGTPAGRLFFGVQEIKAAPGRDKFGSVLGQGDNLEGDDPRKWASGPLPLGGTYRIHGWRGNAFCVSRDIRLTEEEPDAEVELQFPSAQTFSGMVVDPDGRPVPDTKLEASFSLSTGQQFGLKSVQTDQFGRFNLAETTPGLGEYSIQTGVPGMMAERVKLDFRSGPQTIRLQPGRTLGGQVVEDGTGWPIPGMKLRAHNYENLALPSQSVVTDGNGRFIFTSLGARSYRLFPEDGALAGNRQEFQADGGTNQLLAVKLYEWSKVKPKAP